MTIEEAKYRPFSYRPTLKDDCVDDEQDVGDTSDMEDEDDYMDDEPDGEDWWDYEDKNDDEDGEEE